MRIGTRRSALALAQAELVAGLLGGRRARPDRDQRGPGRGPARTSRAGSLELEDALPRGDIDLAVHSAKDVPGELADGPRAARRARARGGRGRPLRSGAAWRSSQPGARVGTSSVRRARPAARRARGSRGRGDARKRRHAPAQARRPGRGFDAIVLARAGLQRLGREVASSAPCSTRSVRAGARAGHARAEGRAGTRACARLSRRSPTQRPSRACWPSGRWPARSDAELPHAARRAVRRPAPRRALRLRAWVGLPDGSAWVSDELVGERSRSRGARARVAARLKARGRRARCCSERTETLRGGGTRVEHAAGRRVYLVGAGPGDPGLLTARALELIADGRRDPL